MTSLTANMLQAVAGALKCSDGRRIELDLQPGHIRLYVNQTEIALSHGHAQEIVGGLLRGLLSSLKGTEKGSHFQFIYEQ
jgi:hypothetical protein